jgi:RimJ/RimL family protein N-acetyltransferase
MTLSLLLVTLRLVLRPYEDKDFDDLYAFYSRPDVATYLYWTPGDAEKVRTALARKKTQTVWQEQAPLVLAVTSKDEAKVVGEVVLVWRSQKHREGEIGFVFHPEYQGRGYAAEASRAMLELGFGTLDLHRIIGRCDARNTASARLMERLGMRREGHFVDNEWVKDEWTSELVYALLQHEWRAKQDA